MKFLMNDFPAASFLDELERNPDKIPGSGLKDRISQYRNSLGGSESITAGLQTFRQLGWPLLTFYLCRYRAELFYFLLGPIQELHTYVVDQCGHRGRGNIQNRLRLTVTLVFSSAGGTGSSIGLLLANILHYLLPHRGGFTRYSLEADILLPGPMTHKAVNVSLLSANTYATLSEILMHYATPNQPLPNIRIGFLDLARRKPFSHIYLWDGINRGGYTFKDRRHVCEVRNLVNELRNSGDEGAEYGPRLADIHFKYPYIFSAAGAFALIYDDEYTSRDFGYRTANDNLAQLTLQLSIEEVKQRGEDTLTSFLERHRDFASIPNFATDQQGKRFGYLCRHWSVIQQENLRNCSIIASNRSMGNGMIVWTH